MCWDLLLHLKQAEGGNGAEEEESDKSKSEVNNEEEEEDESAEVCPPSHYSDNQAFSVHFDIWLIFWLVGLIFSVWVLS